MKQDLSLRVLTGSIILSVLLLSSVPVLASKTFQPVYKPTLEVKRTSTLIKIDGILDDAVCLLVDTYGEATWAYEFFVNPYGVQKDNLWTSVQGSDSGFDLIWRSAAKITENGYHVEMAIPFSRTSSRHCKRSVAISIHFSSGCSTSLGLVDKPCIIVIASESAAGD